VSVQLYRNVTGSTSCGRRQLIIWKDRLNGTRLLEVTIYLILSLGNTVYRSNFFQILHACLPLFGAHCGKFRLDGD